MTITQYNPNNSLTPEFKVGVNMKAIFWQGIMVLMQISCSHFKQSKISLLIPHIFVLGCFVNFW